MCEQSFAWITKYGITTRHMNQHQFSFSGFYFFLCDLENKKNRKSSKEWKDIGIIAEFENGMRCECVYCSIGACYSLSWSTLIQKQAQRVVLGGSKIGVKSFVLCWYENEPYTPLLFCTRFKQGKGFFLCQPPVATCPGSGARTRSDKMENRHLELSM